MTRHKGTLVTTDIQTKTKLLQYKVMERSAKTTGGARGEWGGGGGRDRTLALNFDVT